MKISQLEFINWLKSLPLERSFLGQDPLMQYCKAKNITVSSTYTDNKWLTKFIDSLEEEQPVTAVEVLKLAVESGL